MCIVNAFAGAQGAKSWLGGGWWRGEDLRNPTQWLSHRLPGGIFEKTAWRKDNTWLRESGFMIFIWYLEITQYVTITPLLPFRSIALMEQTWFHFAIFPNQNQHSEGLYDSRPNKLARLEHAKSHRNYIGVGSLKSDVGSYLASDQSNKKWWCHRCRPILTIPIVHIMCWMALQLNSRPLWCHFNCTISQEASIPQHRRAKIKEYQLIIWKQAQYLLACHSHQV